MAGNVVDVNYLPKKPVPALAAIGGSVPVKDLNLADVKLRALVPNRKTNTPNRPQNTKVPFSTEIGAQIGQEALVVDIDTKSKGRQVPLGFIGVSYEWNAMGFYGRDPHIWAKMFTVLGPGHIIRLGGQSQEWLSTVSGMSGFRSVVPKGLGEVYARVQVIYMSGIR
jgi:hypothetical protein